MRKSSDPFSGPSAVEASANAASATIAADAANVTSHLEYVLDERAGPLDTEQKRVLEAAWRCSRRLAKLAGDLHDLALAEAGGLTADTSECDLSSLLGRAVEAVWPVAYVARKAIDVRIDGEPRALGDRALIARAIEAVVEHSVEHAQVGTPISIRAGEIGIDLEFDAAEAPESDPLGLTLAGAFARLHGGELGISTEGDRVAMTITFGARVAAAA